MSSEVCPPASLTSSNCWELTQDHSLGGPGGWGRGPENRPISVGKGSKLCKKRWVNVSPPLVGENITRNGECMPQMKLLASDSRGMQTRQSP
eukprot:scaffold48420_cov19-Tisochrysis_lutea.AAC.1